MAYENESTARARVTFTVEADAGSTWGHNCTAQQIYDQAGREATNALEQVLQAGGKRINARIVGKPEVVAVFATPDTRASQTAREPESATALTVGDVMRASHPGAPAVLDSMNDALNSIYAACRDDNMSGVEDALRAYGFKFDD